MFTSVAADSAGDVFITGYTDSRDISVTSGAFQTGPAGTCCTADAFVTKLALGSFTTSSAHSRITVSPTTGAAGSVVTVTGSGFAAGQAITWQWDASSRQLAIASFLTDSKGGFSAPIKISSDASIQAGAYQLSAVDQAGHVGTSTFTIACFFSMPDASSSSGDPSRCAQPTANTNRLLLLVPGISCPTPLGCNLQGPQNTIEYARSSFFPNDHAVDASLTDHLLDAALAPLGFGRSNEIPFSYIANPTAGGYLNAPKYAPQDTHEAVTTTDGKLADATSAGLLANDLKTLVALYPGVHLYLLSHSLGGLVTANALWNLRQSTDPTDRAAYNAVVYAVASDSPLRGMLLPGAGAALAPFVSLLGFTASDPVYADLQDNSAPINQATDEQNDPKLFVVTNASDFYIPPTIAYLGSFAGPVRSFAGTYGMTTDQAGHGAVFSHTDGTAVLAQVLSTGSLPSLASAGYVAVLAGKVGVSLLSPFGAIFIIRSPADVLVTDPLGRRVGYDPATQAVLKEIPGATYSGPGTEPQIVAVPNNALGQYTVTLTGTGSGQYHLDEVHQVGATIQSTTIAGNTTPGQQTIASVNVAAATAPVLQTTTTTATSATFSGTLTLNGQPAPVGTTITAFCPHPAGSRTLCGSSTVSQAGAYQVLVYGIDGTAGGANNAQAGDAITFLADGNPATAAQSVIWQPGVTTTVALTAATSTTESLTLTAGWHLIAFSRLPSSTKLHDVLASLGSSDDIVLGFDASAGGAQSYFTATSMQAFNTLTDLKPLHGYWVHLTTAGTLTVTGTPLAAGTTLALTPGWNLVGYAGATAEPLATAFGHLHNAVDITLGFDPSQGGALSYFTAANMKPFNNLSSLQPNAGYWLHVTGSASQNWGGE